MTILYGIGGGGGGGSLGIEVCNVDRLAVGLVYTFKLLSHQLDQ